MSELIKLKYAAKADTNIRQGCFLLVLLQRNTNLFVSPGFKRVITPVTCLYFMDDLTRYFFNTYNTNKSLDPLKIQLIYKLMGVRLRGNVPSSVELTGVHTVGTPMKQK